MNFWYKQLRIGIHMPELGWGVELSVFMVTDWRVMITDWRVTSSCFSCSIDF